MSALRELTFHKRREDRPPEIEEMADFFAENGWTLCEEWLDPWYDEEEDEHYEGTWSYSIVYEEMIGDELHMWHVAPVSPTSWPEAWKHLLELGRMGWEHYKSKVE